MRLLTIAHKGEAAEFIRRKHNLQVDFHFKGLYRHQDELLLLTRQGMPAAADRTEAVLSYFGDKIELVLNLGIAGALTTDLQINQFYAVKRVWHEAYAGDKNKVYKSDNKHGGLDCISVTRLVEDKKRTRELLRYAKMVDMELWAVAEACHRHKILFLAWKLISDYADSPDIISNVQAKAATFSKHLFDFYKKLPL